MHLEVDIRYVVTSLKGTRPSGTTLYGGGFS
jgi:hypothetical protein